MSDLSETDIVHNGTNLWTYSSDNNSVSHTHLEVGQGKRVGTGRDRPVDPTTAAEQALAKINPSTAVTVDRTAEVAGRPAYQLDLSPRDSRTLISSVRIALDSSTSMPLRVQIWARTNTSSPAFQVGFTSLTVKAPSASTFDLHHAAGRDHSVVTVRRATVRRPSRPPTAATDEGHRQGLDIGVRRPAQRCWPCRWAASARADARNCGVETRRSETQVPRV